jgi:Phosphoenolpyruvate synthase/pyruvate phosphate dikinase
VEHAARGGVPAHVLDPDDLGTAVNVVQMVFGNKGERSATGVCFTRDPSTGEQGVYGEYLVNAQGEDVVAGIRTPQPVEQMQQILPEAYEQLLDTMARLEQHYRDMQDVEFTVEEGRLYMLQTRSAKRTAQAALKAAVDMTGEGLISREEAITRIDRASSTSCCIRCSTRTRSSRSRRAG